MGGGFGVTHAVKSRTCSDAHCSLRTEFSKSVQFPKLASGRNYFFFKGQVLLRHSVNFRAGICVNNKIRQSILAVLDILKSLYAW
jgi:hypothetical protein